MGVSRSIIANGLSFVKFTGKLWCCPAFLRYRLDIKTQGGWSHHAEVFGVEHKT
jgi:hypothetical protein